MVLIYKWSCVQITQTDYDKAVRLIHPPCYHGQVGQSTRDDIHAGLIDYVTFMFLAHIRLDFGA
jgi:hypothetical protein